MLLYFLLPLIIVGSTTTGSKVTTSVSGDDAVVKTNIVSEVNGERVSISSDKPGTVEVKQKNGMSSVTINGIPVSPTITVSSGSAVKKWGNIIADITRSIRSFLLRLLDNVK